MLTVSPRDGLAASATRRAHAHEVEDHQYAHLVPRMLRSSREYLRRQWAAPQVRETQVRRLVRCLTDAVRSVPAYRNAGISPAQIHADPWASLYALPTVHKAEVQAALEDYVADDFEPDDCFRVVTSGSTGVPLVLLHDEGSLADEAASFYRLLDTVAFEPGDRVCRVLCDRSRAMWGVTVQLMPGAMELAVLNLLKEDLSWWHEGVRRLSDWAPAGLVGNPSDLLMLALLANDDRIAMPSVRFVITAGENLLPNTRVTLEQTFGCRVYDVYSMQEMRGVAWECEAGTLHVNDDRVVVESLESGGGEPPELVITPLTNRSMPLLRYRTADLGRYVPWQQAPCPCRRQLGSIADFAGRDRGFVLLPEGRRYGPKPIKQFLTDLPVAAWQLVQREPERLQVLLVARDGDEQPGLAWSVERVIGDLLQHRIAVDAKWVRREEMLGTPAKFQMMHLMSGTPAGRLQSVEGNRS